MFMHQQINKDELAKDYFHDPDIFADLANVGLFQGRSIIQAEQLEELDPIAKRKRRDVLKRWKKEDGSEIILGIEIQSFVDPSMPIRVMEYDMILYKRQIEMKQKEHEKNKLQKGEFLSGIQITDRFQQVVTLVLNLSGEIWNGAKSLNELLEPNDLASDYKMRLVEPSETTEETIQGCKSEVGKLLRAIKATQRKEELEVCMKSKEYEEIEIKTAQMINVFSDMKLRLKEQGGKVNMCRAMDELRRDWKGEGIIEGKAEGKAEAAVNTAMKMIEDGFSDEMIMKYVDLSFSSLQKLRRELVGA